jgi:site-specific DNA-cytosine methylase
LKGEKEVDVIIGGPPCQAYSVAGRARMGKDVEKDPRNELYKYYVRFLERYNPRMFVFENVLGILTAKRGEPFADLKRLVEELDSGDLHFKIPCFASSPIACWCVYNIINSLYMQAFFYIKVKIF